MVEVRVKDPFGTFVDFKDGNGIDFGPSHGPMNFIPGGTLYSFSLLIDPTMSGIFEIEFVMSMSDPGASIKIQPPPIVSELQSSSQLVCESLDYRFGFNGMEKDNEAKGQGNSYDFVTHLPCFRGHCFWQVSHSCDKPKSPGRAISL